MRKDVRIAIWYTVLATAAYLTSFVLGYALTFAHWSTVDWGDAPTWTATVGAAVASFFAYRLFRVEARRDDSAARSAKEAQASRVAGWGETAHRQWLGGAGPWSSCLVRNASELPVFNLKMFAFEVERDDTGEPSEYLPRWARTLAVAPPDNDATRIWLPTGHRHWDYAFVIEFTDCASQTWHRQVDGTLRSGPYTGHAEEAFEWGSSPDPEPLEQKGT